MQKQEFREQVLPMKDKLYRFALRWLRNPADAQDVVQEAFIRLWQQGDALYEIKSMEAFGMRITRNLCIDRSKGRHRQTSALDEAPEKEATAPTPYEHTAQRDGMQHLTQLMQQLPELHRQCMELRDIEGMSYQEIAELLDLNLSQVKTNIFRARNKMRHLLLKTGSYER